MFPQSLRWRIQIWHGSLLAAVLTGLGVAAWRYQSGSELNRAEDEVRQHMRVLADGLGGAPGPRGPGGREGRPPPRGEPEFRLPPERAAMFEPADGAGFYYVVWRRDGSVWARSAAPNIC